MSFKIHFVTGKGGVGKSAYSLALAQVLARKGHRTLLVELGDSSFYQNYLGLSEVSFEPSEISENLGVSLWTGKSCLAEYALHLIKVPSLVKIFLQNPLSQALIDVAPGLPELAILGKITSQPRRHGPPFNYDRIVVDAYASGHFLSLIRAPRGMAEAISQGPMGTQSRGIDEVLKSSELCQYHVVSLAADLPLTEGVELSQSIHDWVGYTPHFILNKVVSDQLAKDVESSSKDDFSQYLQFQVNKKSLALEYLKEHQISVEQIQLFPMLYSHLAELIADEMSHLIEKRSGWSL